jgi:hypothetical protein
MRLSEDDMKLRPMFKPPTPAQREYWQKLKAGGKDRFIVRVGILGWGGFMFVIMTLLDLVRTRPPSSSGHYILDTALNLVIWPLGGYFVGRSLWHSYEKRFSEQSGDQSSSPG